MPFKAAHPLDVLSQGLAPACEANHCLRLLLLTSATNCTNATFHPQFKAVVYRPFIERMRVLYFHQVSGCCDGVGDFVPHHHLWQSNHIWHLLYFFFLLRAILLYVFCLLYNGEPLKTWVISWLSVSVSNLYPCFRLYFLLSCSTANKLLTTVKWFIMKDRKNRSLVNSCSRYFLVGMSNPFSCNGQKIWCKTKPDGADGPSLLCRPDPVRLKQCSGAERTHSSHRKPIFALLRVSWLHPRRETRDQTRRCIHEASFSIDFGYYPSPRCGMRHHFP